METVSETIVKAKDGVTLQLCIDPKVENLNTCSPQMNLDPYSNSIPITDRTV